MAYKSLLAVITETEGMDHTLAAAARLAARFDAHLEVLCLASAHTVVGLDHMGGNGVLIQQIIDVAQQKAENLEAAARGHMAGQSIRWSAEGMMVHSGRLLEAVAGHARFSDVMVHEKPFGKAAHYEGEAAIEAALFDARIPVLVLPDGTMSDLPAKRILVAWNQSNEAMAAVRAAMPLLIAADLVTVMIVDPAKMRGERSDPGGSLSQMLARHNVKVEVTVLAKTLPRFCDMLNRHARDTEADMVVMGAYGHSRLRESILGGATRDMLELAEVPVFMAH